MQTKTLADVKAYLQRVKPLFINGQIRLVSEDGIMKITYKDSFQDFIVKEKVKDPDRKAVNQIVDFCFSCYSERERQGNPLNSEQIWILLNMKPNAVRFMLSSIYHKLKIYGESILGENEKAQDVQDHWQETEWSLIPKKQSTKFPWSEKERIEVPLRED